MGELHPKHRQSWGLTQAPLLFELALDPVLAVNIPMFKPVSKFPVVQRDLAVVVNQTPFGFLLVAATLFFLPGNLPALLAAFVVLALAVSVIEISSYGFTVTALTRQQLDFFSGITTSFIRLGTLLAGTALLFAAGIVTQHHGVHHAWAWLFVGFAVAALAFYGYFRVFLPAPAIAQAVAREPVAYRVLLRGYFRQPHAFAVLGFLISYRVGEGFFDRMRLPFLLDPTAAGGLGLSLQEAAGLVPLGTLAIVVGGALGAGAIVRWGFNRVCPGIIPMDS